MGVWGDGNFESDIAMDTLSIWINKMRDCIRDSLSKEHDELMMYQGDELAIIANIDIISTLCNKYNIYPDIELSEIREWKSKFLSDFDKFEPYTIGEENRRRIIEETFDELIKIVKSLWEDN